MHAAFRRPDAFRHEALPFHGQRLFADACAGAVRAGLAADERMIVLASYERLGDVRDELGRDAAEVALVPTDEHGRNPSRIATLLHNFQASGDGRHTTGVSELRFAGRSPAEAAEIQLSDQLLNEQRLQTWPLTVLCLFDTVDLDERGLRAIRAGHPVIRGVEDNGDFDPALARSLYAEPLDPPPPSAARLEVARTDLPQLRAFVGEQTSRFALAPDRVDDLVLAANEIATNSMRYGGGRATVAIWSADSAVICDIRDRGHITDPLAGRFAPPPSAASGRGLWLVNHLCDLVQLRSSAAGTEVRLHLDC